MRVELLATPGGDKAALALLFDVGADHDPAGRSGMAHLVEHLFSTAGVGEKSARTIKQLQEQVGHGFHAITGSDYTLYAMEVPAGRIMEEMDDAALRMSRLTPKESDLTRERARLLDEIATAQERDAPAAAMLRAAEAVRPSRAGGMREGVAAEVGAITLDEAEAFRRAHYGGATARLIVAGRFDLEEATKRIKAAFAGVPGGKVAEPRPAAGSKVTGTLVMGDAPSALAVAVPAPATRDPLYAAFLALAARVLDPPAGTRTWKADFAPLARPEVLFVQSQIAPGEPAEPAAARVRTEVDAVVGGPATGDESDRVLARFGSTLGMTPTSAEACAAQPFECAFAAGRRAQLGVDGSALAQAVRSITPEQLAAAAKLFGASNSAAVIAGGKAP
ncbi:MAG TPA: insulinase family protein [Polyangia bacterium]|nr:insulinase family protein [Polyangia bacterium]